MVNSFKNIDCFITLPRNGVLMKEQYNIPFSPPDISELEIQEVCAAVKSNWITTGARVKKFEKLIADYLNVPSAVPNCVCLNSQTACAEMSLRLLGIGPQEGGDCSDEVITCAYTYTASASVVCHVGAKLVLVDCNEDSLEINYDAVEASINENTKAIIPIDLGGVPCDYDRLFEIVERKKSLFKPSNKIQEAIGRVAIVEDAAHAFGATYKDKKIGTIADFTNFSFHAVKNLTTGEGGAVTWRHINGIDDADIYQRFQLYSLHGQSKDAFKKNQPGMWEYDIVGPWFKCNMTDIHAALGLAQIERYPAMLVRRKQIIDKYDEAFKPIGVEVLAHYNDDHSSSGHLYITRVPEVTDEQRREIIIKMAESGVSTNVHYKPLPLHTGYKGLGFDIKDFPNSYARYSNEITLPLNTCLKNCEVDYIIDRFKKILADYI